MGISIAEWCGHKVQLLCLVMASQEIPVTTITWMPQLWNMASLFQLPTIKAAGNNLQALGCRVGEGKRGVLERGRKGMRGYIGGWGRMCKGLRTTWIFQPQRREASEISHSWKWKSTIPERFAWILAWRDSRSPLTLGLKILWAWKSCFDFGTEDFQPQSREAFSLSTLSLKILHSWKYCLDFNMELI